MVCKLEKSKMNDFFFKFILQLVGAAFGAAGQRCMALSTAIFVGEAKKWIPDLVEKAKKLKVNAGLFLTRVSVN